MTRGVRLEWGDLVSILFAIGTGGALGALLRYWMANAFHSWTSPPYGTLARSFLYVGLSIVVCVASAWAGATTARQFA